MTPNLLADIEAAETEHLGLYGGERARFGGVRSVYAGPGLPVNVACGFGQNPTGLGGLLDDVEAFYTARQAVSRLVVYSHFPAWTILAERGYRLTLLLHIYARALDVLPPLPTNPVVRPSPPDEFTLLTARAFGEGNEAIMRLTGQRTQTQFFAAEVGGQPVGAGAVSVFGTQALLFSTATLPAFRGRGAQTALLAARLHAAKDSGACCAAVLTVPGSASERNVQRAGFVLMGARLRMEQG